MCYWYSGTAVLSTTQSSHSLDTVLTLSSHSPHTVVSYSLCDKNRLADFRLVHSYSDSLTKHSLLVVRCGMESYSYVTYIIVT